MDKLTEYRNLIKRILTEYLELSNRCAESERQKTL
jgi:hypothetical protein